MRTLFCLKVDLLLLLPEARRCLFVCVAFAPHACTRMQRGRAIDRSVTHALSEETTEGLPRKKKQRARINHGFP